MPRTTGRTKRSRTSRPARAARPQRRAKTPSSNGESYTVSLQVNGVAQSRSISARTLLVDFLRDDLGLTGTHIGCDTSHCGACTVLLDGRAVKSCTMFAAQADGTEITTIEGLSVEGRMHPVQEAFKANHGLQCGYCTPGVVLAATAFLKDHKSPSEDEIRAAISGNLCRCTGYQNIVKSVAAAAARAAADGGA